MKGAAIAEEKERLKKKLEKREKAKVLFCFFFCSCLFCLGVRFL